MFLQFTTKERCLDRDSSGNLTQNKTKKRSKNIERNPILRVPIVKLLTDKTKGYSPWFLFNITSPKQVADNEVSKFPCPLLPQRAQVGSKDFLSIFEKQIPETRAKLNREYIPYKNPLFLYHHLVVVLYHH